MDLPKQNRTKEDLLTSKFFRLLLAFTALSGISFACPAFYRYLAGISGEALLFHTAAGTILIAMALSFALRLRRNEKISFPKALWQGTDQTAGPFLRRGIKFLFLLCAPTGALLALAPLLPLKLLGPFLSLHRAGGFALLALLVPVWIILASRELFDRVRPSAEKGNRQYSKDPEHPGIPLTGFTGEADVERFLEIFGGVLGHSNLRIFLSSYLMKHRVRTIFSANHDQAGTFAPADYLISIFHRYFTISGAIDGWLFPNKKLTADHIRSMAELFYRHIPCCAHSNINPDFGDQGRIAKFGRFMLARTDIVPAMFGSNVAVKGPRSSTDNKFDTFADSVRRLESEIEKTTGSFIRITVDKPGADIMLVPEVHDYVWQSDTITGMIVLLNAMQSNWTLSKAFFDGVNYDSFYGDWFIDQTLISLREEARKIGAHKVLLGGCPGISLVTHTHSHIQTSYDFLLQVLHDNKVRLKNEFKDRLMGIVLFCDTGCYLGETGKLLKTLHSAGIGTVQIGQAGNMALASDHDILSELQEKKPDMVISPYHNSRQRMKHLIGANTLDISVLGLYDLLAMSIPVTRDPQP